MASRSSSNPKAEVVVVEVSPTNLMDSNRHICEVCSKGFSRKQNLLLHGRAHNLPITHKTRTPNDPILQKVYLCPEPTCFRHNRSHALGDFGGLKKHYLRKHVREKKHKCGTCSKAYSVEGDLKAHRRGCASRFPRGKFTTHQENCEAPQHVVAVTGTTYTNRSNILISSANSHSQTLGMGDNPIRFHRNQSCSTIIAPQISFIQNQPKFYPFTAPYQSKLSQFGANHSGLVTYPLLGSNFTVVPPQFQATSSNQNLREHQENVDVTFYADLLINKTPLEDANLEDMNVYGNYENDFTGESSKYFADGGFLGDPSGSLPIHNHGPEGMPNHVAASSFGGWYAQGGYSGYGAESWGPYGRGMEMLISAHQPQQQSHNVNVEDMDVHGDHWNIYRYREDTQLFQDAGSMLDQSNSLNLTPDMHNHGLIGMLNPVTGSSDVGSHEQGGCPVANGPSDNLWAI